MSFGLDFKFHVNVPVALKVRYFLCFAVFMSVKLRLRSLLLTVQFSYCVSLFTKTTITKFHRLSACKSKIKVCVGLVSKEASVLGFQVTTFLCFLCGFFFLCFFMLPHC
jgi:hypothetical protein